MEYRENRDARRPFLSTPDSRVYFPAAAIEEARRSTARCLRRNEGVALVVGATGTGKTLLARVLAAEFEAESLVAVVSPTRRIDAKSFWQQFLFGLRQTFCGCDETELRLMALDYLERSQRRRCVLLIDDAQNLPFRVFDELRSFVDQGAAAASQICVALFGTSVLEERLNLPPLYPFQQRIVSRSYLDAFESAEIADYIDCETRRVAGKFVFTSDAKRKVADLCKGSPRVANQLCDRALFLTAQESGKDAIFTEQSDFNDSQGALERIATESVDIRAIDASLVERAWANLLNLPEETPRLKAGELGDVVEFGTLEDDEDEFGDFAGSVGSADFNVAACEEANAGERAEKAESRGGVESVEFEEVGEVDEVAGDRENGRRVADVDDADWAVCVNNEDDATNKKFDERIEASEEMEATDDEAEENNGEIDAALEARLLQNLKIWEDANAKANGDGEQGIGKGEEENAELGDRWERADALKERRDVDEWKARAEIARVAEAEGTNEDGEAGARLASSEFAEVAASTENGEENAVELVATFETVENENGAEETEQTAQKTEERVFEALKSEYFNEGFLFELAGDGAEAGGDEGKKSASERKKKGKPRSKSTSKTRRPIVGDDDGSRLWNEANGRRVDGGTSTADDERFWEMELSADRVAKRGVTNEEAEAAAAEVNWEAEFVSLEDRAYEQIVEDCWETTDDFAASDEYLSELSLLEQEIEEEANLIRRIRNIHLKLRSVRAAADRKRRRNAVENNAASSTNVEGTTRDGDNIEDGALNY